MSLFDKDLIDKSLVNENELAENRYLSELLTTADGPSTTIIWMKDESWLKKFTELFHRHIQKKENINLQPGEVTSLYELDSTNDYENILESHRGRPVISVDCRTLKDSNDTGNFFNLLEKISVSPKPIILIENITDIPSLDRDESVVIENRLLHSWKNYPSPATIIIPILESKKEKINFSRLRTIGYAHIDFAKVFQEGD